MIQNILKNADYEKNKKDIKKEINIVNIPIRI